jgi:hypothetical protein
MALLSRTGVEVALLPAQDVVGNTTWGSAGELLWDSGVPDLAVLDSCKLEFPIISQLGEADDQQQVGVLAPEVELAGLP